MTTPKSAGLFQRFDDFSNHVDLVHKMRTSGLSAAEAQQKLGFNVVRTGDYIPVRDISPHGMYPEVFQQAGYPQQAEPQGAKRRMSPDMPYPRPQQRDDIEQQYRSSKKPKYF